HLPPEVKRAGLHEVYRVLKPGGRLLVVDVDWSHARPWWQILSAPVALIPLLRDHWAGRLSSYFVQAGFWPVEAVGRWRWCWGFWLAHRPSASESRLAAKLQPEKKGQSWWHERHAFIQAPVDEVFAYVDEPTRLSSHMRQSSWQMGGGRMVM